MDKIGIYVHIPFCATKCPYCSFYSEKYSKTLAKKYVDSIIVDMQNFKGKAIADTLYFGGGTPSIIDSCEISRIIEAANKCFNSGNLIKDITIEANPNSATKQKITDYAKLGINRISFGMQSADKTELNMLGRTHSVQQTLDAVDNSISSGIKNCSLDIMLGTPKQTINSLKYSLDIMANMPITHISAYMLSIEDNTPYQKSPLIQYCPNDDAVSDMYLFAVDYLQKKGFFQYEISNFAKANFESQHNLKYWNGSDYLGFGTSAHSFFKGKRFYSPNDINLYINTNGEKKVIDDNICLPKDVISEYIMLRLRLCSGIEFKEIFMKFNIKANELLTICQKYIDNKFMSCTSENLFLTPKGFLISNTIIVDILDKINY
ncbi:MAG: radical SAM family heme chaperone HemW [Oscillospiraceae bacterium]